ncbi:primosome assembly protein PriA [Ornithinimicrobium kibberense]|uniref:primosomal protein N' family DNA-binding protein n=1 Tax=Ornithinimicrobium kibberense TaxID=282060 RepID=UPI001EE37125|nr:primosome assembly protein PriA [Ornithinimicrobium kibberense]
MEEQLTLVPPPAGARRRRRPSPPADRAPADRDPVAQVVIDTPLPHLDRVFEYVVPHDLADAAQPGVRVRVRMAGRQHDGFVVARAAEADHPGRLSPVLRVVGAEPVLTADVLAAARAVADHYGGTLADVLRLAVPPRHARAESAEPPPAEEPAGPAAPPSAGQPLGAWSAFPAGPALLRRLAAGESPVAAWTALPAQTPGTDWPDAVAEAVAATRSGGRGAVVVVPDRRDVDRVLAAVSAAVGEQDCVALTADLGPEARYRAFLRLLRGHTRVAVGTRAAAWAPVRDLGLLVCWDDGDDLHQEPRAPYPHVREVLRLRAVQEGAGLLVGGLARSVPLQAWVATGLAADVVPGRSAVRAAAPSVLVAGEGRQEDRDPAARTARIPSLAWRALRDGLEEGPVLVQVSRQGYVVALACQECRTPVRCPRCAGPVGVPATGTTPVCRWCGLPPAEETRCRACGSGRLRAIGVGERRTAEELGRAFPGVRVLTSGGASVVATVEDTPMVVVATPGAEPWAPGGYRAAALLDGWQLLDRASLDAAVEALRRWSAAAAMVRPAPREGPGRVVLCGVPPHAQVPAVEALVRWDPVWLAARELADRVELGLPPVRRHVLLRGAPAGVKEFADRLEELGHVPLGGVRATGPEEFVAVLGEGRAGSLPADVRAVRAALSARRSDDQVRAVLDPLEGPR